jgi:hypothetical protein
LTAVDGARAGKMKAVSIERGFCVGDLAV